MAAILLFAVLSDASYTFADNIFFIHAEVRYQEADAPPVRP